MPSLRCYLLVLASSLLAGAQTVTIVTPRAGAHSVSSPVRVVVEFSNTAPITSTAILVDGVNIGQDEGVTPIDVYIPMSAGQHALTVNAVQADGLQLSSSRTVDVSTGAVATSGNLSTTTAAGLSSTTSGTTSITDIQEKSGWYVFTDQGHPLCSLTPILTASPSLDGASGKFDLSPTGQFNNCLWAIKLGTSKATHFTLDAEYQLSNPSAAQGIEFSSNKHVGTEWYKFSVQCSYYKGVFSVWDTAGSQWVATTIPCKQPALNTWDHLTVQTEINNGRAVFLSLTLNGVTYPINKSFAPLSRASSYAFGVHFQMDGNRTGDAYSSWVDKFDFTLW